MDNNITSSFGNFFISYNEHDRVLYGSDTTAFVIGNHGMYMILNGDHRQGIMMAAEGGGIDGAFAYFLDNIHDINHRSLDCPTATGLLPDRLGNREVLIRCLGDDAPDRLREALTNCYDTPFSHLIEG